MTTFSRTMLILPLPLALVALGGSGPAQIDGSVGPAGAVAGPTGLPGDTALILELADDGNQARYRVREQLVGVDLPNDAVGRTPDVSGRIVLDDEGGVDPEASTIVVAVSGLASDRDRRDGYVRGRILRAEEYPTVELRPTAVRGLPFPLPAAGTHTFELVGDLTVLDVTRPTTWQVTAVFDGQGVTGSAMTRFTFEDFALTQPRVPVVLSVADTIALEVDFDAVATAPGEEAGR
jgi:polyisoprenoid-binding protein YceI